MSFSIADLIYRRLNSAYSSSYPVDEKNFLQTLANFIAGGIENEQTGTEQQPGIAVGNPATGFYQAPDGGIGVTVNGFEQARISPSDNAINRIELRGAPASTAVQLAAAGSDSSVQLNITSKGTSNISLRTGGNQQVLIMNTTSSTNSIGLTGSTASNPVQIAVQGGTNIPLALISRGTGSIQFCTQNNSSRIQFMVADTAGSVVNYVRATGNVASSPPSLSAQGSDTNIDLRLSGKGTGMIDIFGTAATTATAPSSFSATHRVQIKVNGTAYWLPVSSSAW